ncbi:MAG: biotin transporter BioY [Gemmatimonadota bacterium]
MTTLSVAARTPRTRTLGILLAVGVLALASQFALPMPGTPVPLTLQPLVVVLAGLLLGPVDGAIAMVVYLAAGMVGLPVFAPMGPPGISRLLGATGGYLLAYPIAAAVAGAFGAGATSLVARALAAEAGILVLYIGGLAQLVVLSGSFGRAALLGVIPFVAADVVKALAAAAIAGLRRRPL